LFSVTHFRSKISKTSLSATTEFNVANFDIGFCHVMANVQVSRSPPVC
jgi:hypothetical protein